MYLSVPGRVYQSVCGRHMIEGNLLVVLIIFSCLSIEKDNKRTMVERAIYTIYIC